MRPLLGKLLLGMICSSPLLAQSTKPSSQEVDLGINYNALRQNATSGASFWEQGGSVDLSVQAYHGLGAALVVSGGSIANIAGTGVGLTTITTVAGPRYTFQRHRLAVFGEALVGESNGLNSVFPASGGAIGATNSLAVQAGGGLDLHLSHRFAVRMAQASWLRTQFPNASTNVQNGLQVGAGLVLRLR